MTNDNKNQQQQSAVQQYCCHNDEISIIDIWDALMRRKKILIMVFTLVVIAAGIYVFLADAIYESRVTIQIGQVGQVGQVGHVRQVDDLHVVRQRLLSEYAELAAVNVGNNGFVTLVATDTDPTNAQKKLQLVVSELLESHRLRYHEMLLPVKNRLNLLKSRLKDYQNQLDVLDTQITQLREKSPQQAAILMIEKGNIMRAIPEQEEKIAELQFATNELNSFTTHQLGQITVSDNPVKPKSKKVIAWAVMLGLMLGVLAALFVEVIVRARSTKEK